jgi:hypothetical protein
MPMSARLKHDYEALVDEYDQRVAGGESPQEIRASFHSRGIVWGTFQNQRRAINRVRHGTPEEHQDTPEVHPSTPYEVEVLTVHSGTPERSDLTETVVKSYAEHLSTPETTETTPDDQYTQEHLSALPDADHVEVHPGTLEGHQEVMEDISQSVPDAPHISTDEGHQSTPEHLSTPEVHPELSPLRSGVPEHSGVPVRQEWPAVHPGTPTADDWELWTSIKAMWPRVEKMLADRQALLNTPVGTPGNTQKKTYVFDVQHIALIDQYAQDHRLDLKDVIYTAFQEFFERRGYVDDRSPQP